MMDIESTESKINKALGISDIDDFLNDLSVDSIDLSFSEIDSKVKNAVDVLDGLISAYNSGDISQLNLALVEDSFNSIKELIESSKQILKHIHSCIVTTDLLDAEAIDSYSHLLEAAHLTIAEYINLYKNRLGFYDKIKLLMMKHLQDLEKMEIKHKYDVEMLKLKQDEGAIDADGQSGFEFSFDKAIKEISLDDQNDQVNIDNEESSSD